LPASHTRNSSPTTAATRLAACRRRPCALLTTLLPTASLRAATVTATSSSPPPSEGGHAAHRRARAALAGRCRHRGHLPCSSPGPRHLLTLTLRLRLMLMLMLMLVFMARPDRGPASDAHTAAADAHSHAGPHAHVYHRPSRRRAGSLPVPASSLCSSLSLAPEHPLARLLPCPLLSCSVLLCSVCISAQFQTTYSLQRLPDCVSALWPWPSASALPTIAEVLDIHPTSQLLATPGVCWNSLSLSPTPYCSPACNLKLSRRATARGHSSHTIPTFHRQPCGSAYSVVVRTAPSSTA
jgi:hypothetical protein